MSVGADFYVYIEITSVQILWMGAIYGDHRLFLFYKLYNDLHLRKLLVVLDFVSAASGEFELDLEISWVSVYLMKF